MRYQRSLATLLLFILISSCAPMEKDPNSQPISTGTSTNTSTLMPSVTATSTPLPTVTPRARPKPGDDLGFIKGINYFSFGESNYLKPVADRSLEDLAKTGANWVSINAKVTQKNVDSTEIDTMVKSDESIVHAIQIAHSLNLNVMLKMGITLSADDEHYSQSIGERFSAAQWDQWFVNWTEMILHYAQLAEANGVEMFCLSSELDTPQKQTAHFKKLAAGVRLAFSGPITYATMPDAYQLDWWDSVDYIGVDAYFPLTEARTPSIDLLTTNWKPIAADLEALSKKWNRPLIFAEIGYMAAEYAARHPGMFAYTLDPQIQANAYQAAFDVFRDKPWFGGMFWFGWEDSIFAGGMCDAQITPKGKLAENVLRAEYGALPIALEYPASLPIFDEEKIATYPIFTDAYNPDIGLGWSFGTSENIVNVPVFAGQKALKINFQRWSAFSPHLKDVDTSQYRWLEFYIFPTNNLGPLNITVTDENEQISNGRTITRCNYFDNAFGLKLGQWNRVLIPLEQIEADHRLISNITFGNWGSIPNTIWIDQMRLVGDPDTLPNPLVAAQSLTPTPIVFPDISLPTTEVIYDDQLDPNWNNSPPKGDPANVSLDQSDIAVDGKAIKVTLLNFYSLDFRNDVVDWQKSQWLEFDLYVEPKNIPKVYSLAVKLRDATYASSTFDVELLQSQFIEGGKIEPGTWQHVQIPLDLFGPSLSEYVMISIEHSGHGSLTPLIIYVDNVILRGKSTVTLSETQPQSQSTKVATDGYSDDKVKNIYDNFDDPKYDGSLNNLLWTREDQTLSTAKVIQQDGILMISDMENTVGQGALLTLSKWQNPTFGFLEARIKVHYESGSNGNLALDGVSPSLKEGWTEMSLTPDAGHAIMRVLGFAQARVENDTWYILRIEYDDKNNVLSFFLDGKLVTSYEAPNKIESLIPQINLWHPEGGSGVGYIDYVAIGD